MRALIFLPAFLFATAAIAQTPAFDPRSWKGQQQGDMTQVLTIGSAHLGQMEKPPTPKMLEPVLAKLAAFKPDIITHEGLSGEQCEQLRQYKARYPDMWSTYCWGTAEAEMATGLNVSQAMAVIETTLASWPANPTAAQRRKLAATFLAANDRASAQVQWLQLSENERKEGDGVDAALLKILKREGAKVNETMDVAVALAVRLGLNRIYAVDDHTSDSIQGLAGEGFGPELQRIWSNAAKQNYFVAYEKAEKVAVDNGDMLALYRLLNLPETQNSFIEGDFLAAMKDKTQALYGRQYLAWCETRNLRMVANIRAAFGNKPGAKVLNIVGASHKAYYDAYLNMMSDVQLVDAEKVLK